MNTLERTLTFRDLVFIVIGGVIGSGIFIVPATVLRQVGGSVGIALGVWLGAGVLSLLGALTYGELSALKPEAGGIYVYLRDAFGPFVGFLYGWTLFFVITSGTVATLSVAFTAYLAELVPISPLVGRLAAIAMIVATMLINLVGTRESASVTNWATSFKLGALVLMSVLLLVAGDAASSALPAADAAPLGGVALLSAIGLATIGVLWAYEGWQYATFSAGEIRNAQHAFPRGIALGTIVLILVYCLANVSYVAALGPEGVMASPGVAASAVSATFGSGAGRLIAFAILVSIFSAAHATVLTCSRVFYAMARDGVFFRRLAEIHPKTGTPAYAIVASCGWAMLLAFTGTFEQLLTYVVFTGWIFYALGAASIFVYRRREPGAARPFRVPGYPWTPVLFVLASIAIVGNALVTTPVQAMIGLGVVFLGAPAYLLWKSGERVAEHT